MVGACLSGEGDSTALSCWSGSAALVRQAVTKVSSSALQASFRQRSSNSGGQVKQRSQAEVGSSCRRKNQLLPCHVKASVTYMCEHVHCILLFDCNPFAYVAYRVATCLLDSGLTASAALVACCLLASACKSFATLDPFGIFQMCPGTLRRKLDVFGDKCGEEF